MVGNRDHNSSRSGEIERDSCPEFETLSVYFDNELSEPETASVRNHVLTCDRCAVILRDFGMIRGAVVATTPVVAARSLAIHDAPEKSAPTPLAPRRPSPLYPIFTALAAVLVLALIAGNFLAANDADPNAAPTVSGAVIVINGTPFTAEDNDAEFGAASADVMNDEADEPARDAVAAETREPLLTNWNIALLVSIVILAAIGGMWARDRDLIRR
ncbi:MAG: zf-HC2 domain-containing protein [Thermomicrobiales bacterium]|nr:zf-HC2 domain-containing protein [Thermomicrobiales bacterium]